MNNRNKNISRGCEFFYTPNNKLDAVHVPGGHKMEVYDWVDKLPRPTNAVPQLVEVRFKNTRKGFYENPSKLPLKWGDIVAVEGTPGTDVGTVSMVSQSLIARQIKRVNPKFNKSEIKKVLRMANTVDIERWSDAISKEHTTMIDARRLSAELGLDMKIGDVEYQGDGMKAIFYYIADGRVDFRELIKVLFDRFRVRVEMKQIGARQEAGRIGGIGACGRELCCSAWINHFSTIGIGAARTQDLSFNPQKLAGQCCKLKCCLNYEVDTYLDAKKAMPRVSSPLEAMDGSYYLIKSDPLSGTMYFSPAPNNFSIQIPLSAKRVREIQAMNSRGEKPFQLEEEKKMAAKAVKVEPEMKNIELAESITRFDKAKGSNNRNMRGRKRPNAAQKQGGEKAKAATPKAATPKAATPKAATPKAAPKEATNTKPNNSRNRNNRNKNRATAKPKGTPEKQ